MLPPDRLLQVLKTVPLIQFEGWVYRIVAEKYREAPIEIIGSYIAGGRFNISQRFGILYTANSRETALTEVRHFFETSPGL